MSTPGEPAPAGRPTRWAATSTATGTARSGPSTSPTTASTRSTRSTATAPTVDPRPAAAPRGPVPGTGGFGATHLTRPRPAQAAFWSSGTRRDDPTAVLGRRYGAFFIDAVISTVVFGAVLPVRHGSAHPEPRRSGCPVATCSATTRRRSSATTAPWSQLNDTVYEANGGAFLGLCVRLHVPLLRGRRGLGGWFARQAHDGLRVVTEDGIPHRDPRSIVRWAVFAVDGPLSLFLCGIITSAVSSWSSPPRRHGRQHVRRRPRRRRTTRRAALTSAGAVAPFVDQPARDRHAAGREHGASSGVNQCASAISLLVEHDLATPVVARRSPPSAGAGTATAGCRGSRRRPPRARPPRGPRGPRRARASPPAPRIPTGTRRSPAGTLALRASRACPSSRSTSMITAGARRG